MTRRINPAGEIERSRVHGALGALRSAEASLKQATEWLVLAGCPRASRRALDALRAVYVARNSAKGAQRHVDHRVMNTEGLAEERGQRQLAFGVQHDA
jgi:hypothetical protein